MYKHPSSNLDSFFLLTLRIAWKKLVMRTNTAFSWEISIWTYFILKHTLDFFKMKSDRSATAKFRSRQIFLYLNTFLCFGVETDYIRLNITEFASCRNAQTELRRQTQCLNGHHIQQHFDLFSNFCFFPC
jgi:signal transduction histidine kinase